MKFIDLIGKKFGKLTPICRAESKTDKRGWAITCWKCKCDCGAEIVTYTSSLTKKLTKSCGCLRAEVSRALNTGKKGALSGNWKGGRSVNKYGYVIVSGQEFPGKIPGVSAELEHHVIMARHLGRALLRGKETIHHKNGIKSDNRLENLELWFKGQPAGQRTEDLVVWAKEVLSRYCPEALR